MKKIFVVVALLFPSFGFANLLNDPGFEASATQNVSNHPWTAADIGTWAVGDPFDVVGTTAGVSPRTGQKMFQFARRSAAYGLDDVYQIVDLTAYAAQIDAGVVAVNYSAYVNSLVTREVSLTMHGWSYLPTDFDAGFTALDAVAMTPDLDPATWELLSGNFLLQPGMRYLAFGLHTPYVVDYTFVDDASLTVDVRNQVPAPAPLGLMGLGLVAIGFAKRTKRSRV